MGYNLYTYVSNNPVNAVDPSGEGLEWLLPGLVAGNPAAAGIIILGGVAAYLIGQTIVEVTKSIDLNLPKKDTKPKEKPKKDVIFPATPAAFNPIGLVPNYYSGKNGSIIKWTFPGTKLAIFEWNEDIKYGSHYHVMQIEWDGKHLNGIHYKAGDKVPEPWASTFFR